MTSVNLVTWRLLNIKLAKSSEMDMVKFFAVIQMAATRISALPGKV